MEKRYSVGGVTLAVIKSLAYLAVWLIAQLVMGVVIGFVLGVSKGGAATELANSVGIYVSIASNCLAVLFLAFIPLLRDSTLTEKASINKMPPRFFINMVVMGVSFAIAISIILGVLQMLGVFPDSWVSMLEDNNSVFVEADKSVMLIATVIMAPVLEEILFRGFILGTLKKEMHPWIAIFVSAVLFGVMHGTPIGIIYATALGVVMGWLCVKFNSVIPSLIFHMAYNATVSYNQGISIIAAVIAIPVLVFEFIDINKFFRGERK